MRLRAAIAVALALSASSAFADAPPMPFEESVVDLRINGQDEAQTLVVRRDTDGTFLIAAEDFAKLRLKPPTRGVVTVNGQRYYRLGAEIGAQVRYDETTQSAVATLPAAAFLPTQARAEARVAPRATPATGGFLNYEVSAEKTTAGNTAGAILEAGMFSRYGVVTSTAVASTGEATRGVVRLDTTWTRDFPEQMATLRAGDAISAPGAWGRAVRFGGLQFGTNFSTQPTLVTAPLLAASGEAVVPSTVDVFINGQHAANQSVPPGPFTVENLPAITGAGQMQIVVTDALGRQQVVSQPYYSGPTLLRAGLEEYSAEVGAIRRDYGKANARYGDMIVEGTYRRGITNSFTAEVHGEAEASGPRALGVDAAAQLGHAGVLSANAAFGGDDAGSGWRAGLGFEHNAQRLSVFARSEFASENFAQLGTRATDDRMRTRLFGGFGFDLSRFGNVQLAYGQQTFWDAPSVQTVGLSYSATLGAYGFINFFASQATSGDSQTDLLMTWTMPFGARRTVSSSVGYAPGFDGKHELEATASLQQSLPPGDGTGYNISASSSEEYQLGYSMQGRAGRVSVDYAQRNGEDGWRLDGTGGLAFTSAGVMPSRWLSQSFAVVKVDDYAGLTVFLENQPVGRTDEQGRVLIDNLRPYQTNKVSIDPLQLPMDASLTTASMQVTPGYRSGPLALFPAHRSRAVTLKLHQDDGSPVPAGAQVDIDGQSYPVALDGLVYVADIGAAGSGEAHWQGQHCSFLLAVPTTDDLQPDLGTLTCGTVAQ